MNEEKIKELSRIIYQLIPSWDLDDNDTPETIREYTDKNPWETINFLIEYIEFLEA